MHVLALCHEMSRTAQYQGSTLQGALVYAIIIVENTSCKPMPSKCRQAGKRRWGVKEGREMHQEGIGRKQEQCRVEYTMRLKCRS